MISSVILIGQLLGTAFACGLNLYATVALLGMAGRLGLVSLPVAGMTGLQHPIVISVAAALFVVGFVLDRIRFAGDAWEAVHTLIRPAAAGLLAVLALQDMPWYVMVGGAVAAALMAFAAHTSKSGIRVMLWTRDGWIGRHRTVLHTLLSLFEDLAAVGIVIAALLYPNTAAAVAAASLLLVFVTGPRLWRAALLGILAVAAAVRGFFGQPGWRSREQLPRAVSEAIPSEPLGRSPARALPAAVRGLRGAGAYRNGWLAFTCDGPRFVYRTMFGARSAPLPGIATVHLRTGVLTDLLHLRASTGRRLTLFLLKAGPPAAVVAAELSAHSAELAAAAPAGAPAPRRRGPSWARPAGSKESLPRIRV